MIGLMKAVERFNPEMGFRFTTYASWWIIQTIRKARERDDLIHIPIGVKALGQKMEFLGATEELSSEEVVDGLGLGNERAAEVLRAMSINQTLSLDAQVGDNPHTLQDMIHAPADFELERLFPDTRIWQATKSLTEMERRVVLMHYFDSVSVGEIAEMLDTTPGNVRSFLRRALRKMAVLLRDLKDQPS